MSAEERSGRNSRSTLQPNPVTSASCFVPALRPPAPRSAPLHRFSATPAHRSAPLHPIFGPLLAAGLRPDPLGSLSAPPGPYPQSEGKGRGKGRSVVTQSVMYNIQTSIFYSASALLAMQSAVLARGILSVRLSVRLSFRHIPVFRPDK